jgi:hypothetical protein
MTYGVRGERRLIQGAVADILNVHKIPGTPAWPLLTLFYETLADVEVTLH